MGLTDHGVVCGHAPFNKEFARRNLKVIYGCECYVVDRMQDRERVQKTLGAAAFPHVTLLALTGKGYENLLRLHNLAWREGFYYKPRLDWEAIARHQSGLAVLSGCPLGYPTQLCNRLGPEAAWEFLRDRAKEIERFYVELVPSPGLEMSEKSMAHLARAARDLKLPCVLTGDAHFPRPADHAAEDALLAVGTGQPVVAKDRKMRLAEYYYACSPRELLERARAVAASRPGAGDVDDLLTQGLVNAARLGARAEVELPTAKAVSFYQRDEPAEMRLWKWIIQGFKARQDAHLIPSNQSCPVESVGVTRRVYTERAEREWQVLREKGFLNYVLIVADLVREMRSRGALVIARGSAGGSLLCWLLGITQIDPIQHDLPFSRFFDRTRDDSPDIDVDLSERWRDTAIQYLRDSYGAECVARISNFNTLGAKQAVKDAAFALGCAAGEGELVASAVSSSNDDVLGQLAAYQDTRIKSILERRPRLGSLAQSLVGQMRNGGVHAAGVLVAPEALDGRLGLMRGMGGQMVASVDKRGAKSLGYLKLDLLSVRTLDMIERCLELCGKTPEWLETLPLDDQKALGLAKAGWLSGIFQLDGSAARRVAKEIGLDTFTDLAMASILCRPGPADWTAQYAQFKQRPDLLEEYLDAMDKRAADIVRSTLGLVAMQEQVMALASNLAGLEERWVQQLRRDISDKRAYDPDQSAAAIWEREWCERWLSGCKAQDVSDAEALRWWNTVKTHGAYGFNKAHGWAYALLSYWTLFLKAHHSEAFYEAYLSIEQDAFVAKRLIREFRTLGGEVRLLEPCRQDRTFTTVTKGVLAGGWTNLKGVGDATAQKFLDRGPYEGWDALLRALTPVLRAKFRAALKGDVSALLQLAPWHPVPHIPKAAVEARERNRLRTCKELASADKGEAKVLAYVSVVDFQQNRLSFLLEDEFDFIAAKVSSRDFAMVAPLVRSLQIGDFVAATGWWSTEALYIKSVTVVRKSTKIDAAAAKAADKESQ